jgi:hypothetical protein
MDQHPQSCSSFEAWLMVEQVMGYANMAIRFTGTKPSASWMPISTCAVFNSLNRDHPAAVRGRPPTGADMIAVRKRA